MLRPTVLARRPAPKLISEATISDPEMARRTTRSRFSLLNTHSIG